MRQPVSPEDDFSARPKQLDAHYELPVCLASKNVLPYMSGTILESLVSQQLFVLLITGVASYLILKLLYFVGVFALPAGWSLGGGVGTFWSLGLDGPGGGFEVTATSC
ncbi:hypothetical protein DPMN_166696 [Dreissena polymorpha]|uniref:Uncharacterized protein n=1 Tax=Dreissena polymorpha TaxID=45954 RepID=A0A9D4EZC6_DREPO|nr:hypothetical protein DPMN_166696 [Dreissena polymorpha]